MKLSGVFIQNYIWIQFTNYTVPQVKKMQLFLKTILPKYSRLYFALNSRQGENTFKSNCTCMCLSSVMIWGDSQLYFTCGNIHPSRCGH